LFPQSNRARDVRDGLVAMARHRSVQLRFGTRVDAAIPGPEGWTVATSTGPVRASRVILATGGLSVPATGSDGAGLSMARTLGHRIHETYPALTPLTCDAAADAAPCTPHRTLHPAPCTLHPLFWPASRLPCGFACEATVAPLSRPVVSCSRTGATVARPFWTSRTSACVANAGRALSCAWRGARLHRQSGRNGW
jgi:hypothetical protein